MLLASTEHVAFCLAAAAILQNLFLPGEEVFVSLLLAERGGL
jgi:hypothetical protein